MPNKIKIEFPNFLTKLFNLSEKKKRLPDAELEPPLGDLDD